MARLFLAQDIARTADVHIVAGQREARAQRVERLQNAQAPFGNRFKLFSGRNRKIAITAQFAAADAPFELIELSQAEHVGTVHNHGVDARHVDARFDNCGREQQVGLALGKIGHDVFKLSDRHLTVRHQDFDIGHQRAQLALQLGNVGHPRADEKRLAAAEFLAVNRLFYHHLVKRHDKCARRQPVYRRGGDDAQLFDAGQRQLQSARYRRSGERQDMNVGFELLEFFFVRNAEMLLLVDNNHAEIAKLNVFGQQRMRADDNFDSAVFEPLFGLRRLFGRNQPREHFYPYRETFQPLLEVQIMLARQQRGRHNHGHLRARSRHGKSRPQRNLGLAETDVAANQPIHRNRGVQIGHDVGNGVELVIGFVIGKTRAEIVKQSLRRHKTIGFFELTLGGNLYQFFGNVLNPLLDFGLFGLPGHAAQSIELDVLVLDAVARNDVDIFDRYKQFGVVGINNLEAVVRRTAGRDVFQPHKTADAVLDMNDQLADIERRYVGNKIFGSDFFGFALLAALAQDIGLGNNNQVFGLETVRQRHDNQNNLLFGLFKRLFPALGKTQVRNSVLVHQSEQAFARALGITRDNTSGSAVFGQIILEFGINFGRAGIVRARKIAHRQHAAVVTFVGFGQAQIRQPDGTATLQNILQLCFAQIQKLRPDRAINVYFGGGLDLQRLQPRLIIVGNAFALGMRGFVNALAGNQISRGQIIKQRGQRRVIKKRQPVFVAQVFFAVGNRFVNLVIVKRGPESLAICRAEIFDGIGVENNFVDNLKSIAFYLAGGALADGVESADALNFVVKQVNAQRLEAADRKNVDNIAADGVFALLDDLLDAGIAVDGGIMQKIVEIQSAANLNFTR